MIISNKCSIIKTTFIWGGGFVPYVDDQVIDVICQHKTDGSIIPIKIKLQDEDGEFQIYKIYAYKMLLENGIHIMPNGVKIGNHIWTYECRINVFGCLKTMYLMYNINDGKWKCRSHM